MKVSSGIRNSGVNSDRTVALTVTGFNNIDYSRTADVVMNVPFTRMRETMRLIHVQGGKITGVNVTGGVEAKAAKPASQKAQND